MDSFGRLDVGRFTSSVISLPRSHPIPATLGSIILLASPWLYNNYLEFLALGPGGMPYNVRGWLMALFLKLFERTTLTTEEYDRDANKERWLDVSEGTLPVREGPRPYSGFHVAPVRQLSQLPRAQPRSGLTR